MIEASTFEVCGVVHLIRPLGRTATNLETLRQGIAEVEPASLFFHAVQPPLRSPASSDLPPDDFSAWIGGVLQDYETAERLTFATQHGGLGPVPMREALMSVLERPRRNHSVPEDAAFAFLAADTVPVPITECEDLESMFDTLAGCDASAWFYHLVEQPWFAGGAIPLTQVVRDAGAPRLADRIEQLAASGIPLEKLRRETLRTWRRSQLGSRMARAGAISDAERADEGRDAVARLARRIVRGGRSES